MWYINFKLKFESIICHITQGLLLSDIKKIISDKLNIKLSKSLLKELKRTETF